MRLSGQFQICLFFFFYEKIFSVKKAPKRKQTIFTLLEIFACPKNCCLYCLVFACFCFVRWFSLCCVFVRSKFFRKKKVNRLEIVLIISYTILLWAAFHEILAIKISNKILIQQRFNKIFWFQTLISSKH